MLTRDRQRELRATLFRHLDGIVTAPAVVALAERGVLELLAEGRDHHVATLSADVGANEGYLNVALRTLASQGWLDQRVDAAADDVVYSITEAGRIAFEQAGLYDDAVAFTRYAARFHPRKFELEPFLRMERVFAKYREQRGVPDSMPEAERHVAEQILSHVEGALLGPTIVRLGMGGMFHKYFMEASFRPDEFHEDGESFGRLLAMFAWCGWFTERNGTFRFTDEGLFLARRASAYGVTVSYGPTLVALPELIFGDADVLRVESPGEPERHVDREMNVWGSGGAHSAYFTAIDEILIEMFNRPIQDQPRGIVDMGCGNGAFLEHVFGVIERQTERGRVLDDHPLFLVGVDFNEAALRVTRANLTRADIWAKVIRGDIGRPDLLAEDLRNDYGIEVRDLLSVRSFLDHNRPWVAPRECSDREPSTSTGAFAHRGARISGGEVEASLFEHLERWAPYVERFGLLVIELHTLPPALTAANLGRTPATAYDATHGYSDQYLVEPAVFIEAARAAGFRSRPEYSRRFPDNELATVTLDLLEVVD